MVRRLRLRRVLAALLLLLSLPALAGYGCRAAATPAKTVRLRPGERFRYADYVTSKDAPDLVRGQDGLLRLPSWGSSQPVVPAAGSRVISRRFIAPGPLFFETGFGIVPVKGKRGGGARFVVRLISGGRTRVVLSRPVRNADTDDAGWTPTRISLPAKAGEEIEVQLAVEKLGLLTRFPRTAVWVSPTIVAPTTTRRPNFVVVILDAVRPDHLGCYGYSRNTSPWIDRMAAEGVVYEQATSQATWTLASVGSLLTSDYPLLLGAAQMAALGKHTAGPTLENVDMSVSLQGELRRMGYTTLASAGGGFLDPAAGFSSGFDWYWTPPPDATTSIEDHLASLKRRLTATPSEPFFLLLHTYEAHNYLQGQRDDLAAFDHGYSGRLRDKKVLFDTVTQCLAAGLSQADLQYLRDLYDGETHHTDHRLGEFFTWLFAQPWGRDTVLVLTADHGEAFGEHGKLHHGGPPYREVTQVPLIVRYPDGKYRGRKVYNPVGLVDIMPALIQLAGGRVPRRAVGQPLPAPASGDRIALRAILSGCQAPPVLSVREGRWTYLAGMGSSREELYDIGADPGQLHNVMASGGAELARMRRALAGEVMRAAGGYRLLASGPRPSDVTVSLASDKGFAYLLQPTSRRPPVTKGSQATVTMAAGDAPEVVLFSPADPKASVRIEARMNGAMVAPRRLHLGSGDRRAARLPVEIGGATSGSLVLTAPPPPLESDEWGLWVWSLGRPAPAVSPGSAAAMSEETRQRLHDLGYVK